ncbi:MAG: hypothetical protein ABI175_12305, partial [Polyangiales bacterium]
AAGVGWWWFGPNHVTRGRCGEWAAHSRVVARAALGPDLARCKMDESVIDAGGASIETTCGRDVGAGYAAADEKCFLGAASLEDWRKCSFPGASMFSAYEKGALRQRAFLDDLCAK